MTKPNLSPEELAHYRKREVIAHDNAEAISTAAGWAAWEEVYRSLDVGGPELRVPNARYWVAACEVEYPCKACDGKGCFWTAPHWVNCNTCKGKKYVVEPREIHIECERYNDARHFARLVAGGREVEVHPSRDFNDPALHPDSVVDWWQVAWAGSAMDPDDNLHLVARIAGRSGPSGDYRPVRELRF